MVYKSFRYKYSVILALKGLVERNSQAFYSNLTILILEKLINFLSEMSCELSSMKVKSERYKPKYGTAGGSTLDK